MSDYDLVVLQKNCSFW